MFKRLGLGLTSSAPNGARPGRAMGAQGARPGRLTVRRCGNALATDGEVRLLAGVAH